VLRCAVRKCCHAQTSLPSIVAVRAGVTLSRDSRSTAQRRPASGRKSAPRTMRLGKRDTEIGPRRQTPRSGHSFSVLRHGDRVTGRTCAVCAGILRRAAKSRKNKDLLAGAAGFEPRSAKIYVFEMSGQFLKIGTGDADRATPSRGTRRASHRYQ
jgi:hypothetical protein